jgi:sulfite reductase alpha subunit-like flavoprotein
MLRHAQAQLEARMKAEAEQRAAKAKARPTKAARAREQAAKDVSQSVREVYRKLASSLHPDREVDPAERERKTRLMQSANQAYEQGDLLHLLSMQISLLQGDAKTLAQADDARLKVYCAALREQQGVLEQEIAECEAPIRRIFEMGPRGSLPARSAVMSKVDHDTRQLKQGIAGMREEIVQLQDPRTCAAVVDSLELPDVDAIESFDLQAAIGARAGKKPLR